MTDLRGYVRTTEDEGYSQFQQLFNAGNERAKWNEPISPLCACGGQAIMYTTAIRDAVVLIETIHFESLPGANDQKHFLAPVNRSKLTTEHILTVSGPLMGEPNSTPSGKDGKSFRTHDPTLSYGGDG
jgi:hypothetical protein